MFLRLYLSKKEEHITWVRHDKLAPESCLSLKVDHQTAFLVDSHTGRVHGTYQGM